MIWDVKAVAKANVLGFGQSGDERSIDLSLEDLLLKGESVASTILFISYCRIIQGDK